MDWSQSQASLMAVTNSYVQSKAVAIHYMQQLKHEHDLK